MNKWRNVVEAMAHVKRDCHPCMVETVMKLEQALDALNGVQNHKASPASASEGFNHSIGVDRFTTVRGTYWWHVRAGDGTQNIGKFHTKLAAEDMALALLTAFRDGAFKYYQTTLAAAPTTPVSEDQKDAERYRALKTGDFAVDQFVSASYGWKAIPTEELDSAIDAAMQEDKP